MRDNRRPAIAAAAGRHRQSGPCVGDAFVFLAADARRRQLIDESTLPPWGGVTHDLAAGETLYDTPDDGPSGSRLSVELVPMSVETSRTTVAEESKS